MFQNMCSLGNVKNKHKVKMEGMKVKIGIALPYVEPLYKKVPKIIFDQKILASRAQFAKVYDFCNKCPCLKCLKLKWNFTKEEV